jgi:quercetin dioxygenase-like cupin family protein
VERTAVRASVEEQGYAGPIRIFGQAECRRVVGRLQEERRRAPLDWNKGRAATSHDYYALATDDRVLDLVTSVLGEDVVLWGASLLTRAAGVVHVWHTDIESSAPTAETVAVWIGLENTDADSSLKVVPYSHRFGVTLQETLQARGLEREDVTDAEVAAWARDLDGRSGVVKVPATDGETVVFDGRLWHGSHNVRRRGTRLAVLLQYATPRTPIRVPLPAQETWPFEFQAAPRPACIVVSGRDMAGTNRTISGPVTPDSGRPILTSQIQTLSLPLDGEPGSRWVGRRLFRGSTSGLVELECHVSTLGPGPHPNDPHGHEAEEVVVILDGKAELLLESPHAAGGFDRIAAERGAFTYHPSHFTHSVDNVSDTPLTYLVVKWRSGLAVDAESVAGCVVFPGREESGDETAEGGFSARHVLKGETRFLRRLRSHLTTLQPGSGYEPHVDAYDVLIVVLEGLVETLGERVGRNGVIFYAAGEPHGMRNVGDEPAVYLVFELQGRPAMSSPRARGALAERARKLAGATRRRLRV